MPCIDNEMQTNITTFHKTIVVAVEAHQGELQVIDFEVERVRHADRELLDASGIDCPEEPVFGRLAGQGLGATVALTTRRGKVTSVDASGTRVDIASARINNVAIDNLLVVLLSVSRSCMVY